MNLRPRKQINYKEIVTKEDLVYDIQYNLNMGEKNKGNNKRVYCLKAIELSILLIKDFPCNSLLKFECVLKNKINECLKENIEEIYKVKLNEFKREIEEMGYKKEVDEMWLEAECRIKSEYYSIL